MRLRAFAPVLALLAFVFALPAAAQVVPSPYEFIETTHEVEGFVGQVLENRGQLDMGPGGGTMFGARYAIQLSGAFALEGHAFLVPTDRNVYEPTLDEEANLVLLGNASSLVGGLDGRIRFTLTGDRTWNRLAPYLSAGGGAATDLSARSALEDDLAENERFTFGPSFLGVLGGGTRWLPAESISFRLEAAMNLWRLGTPQQFRALESDEIRIPEREWTNVGAVELGVSWRF